MREWVKKVNGEVKSAVKIKAPPTRSMGRWPSTSTGKLHRSITRPARPTDPPVATAIVSVGNAERTRPTSWVARPTRGSRYIYSRELAA